MAFIVISFCYSYIKEEVKTVYHILSSSSIYKRSKKERNPISRIPFPTGENGTYFW